MAIGTLFGGSAESIGLYGNSAGNSVNPTVVNQTYFEWFIFTTSAGTPATPTGGSWDFTTNTGTAPTGWSSFISGVPLNSLWFSIAFIDSRNPSATIVWSTPGLISSQSVYATAYADVFTGDGSTVAWTLSQDPVVVNNTDVSINGVTQIPGTDYTLSSTTLTTTTAAPLGASILVKYRQALPLSYYGAASNVQFTPVGSLVATNVQSAIAEVVTDLALSSGSSTVGYTQGGTGAVATTVQAKLRQTVSVMDFGAVGDGVTDDGLAIRAAVTAVTANGGQVYFPPGIYKVTPAVGDTSNTAIYVPSYVRIVGASQVGVQIRPGANGVVCFRMTGLNGGIENLQINNPVFYTNVSAIRLAPIQEADLTTHTDTQFNEVTNVSIRRVTQGIVLRCGPTVLGQDSYCYYNTFTNIDIRNTAIGIWLKVPNSTLGSGCNRNTFISCRVGETGTNAGLIIDAGNTNKFFGLSFEGILEGTSPFATPTAITIAYNSATYGCTHNQFYGLTIEACTRSFANSNDKTECYGWVDETSTYNTPTFTGALPLAVDFSADNLYTIAPFKGTKLTLTSQDGAPILLNPSSSATKKATIVTTAGISGSYNGTIIKNNYSNVQANTALPSWYLDIGGAEVGNGIGVSDTLGIHRMAAGGSTWTNLFLGDSAGAWKPGTDNTQTLGTAAKRWSVVYAGTGTINTSDATQKQDEAALTVAEQAVAKAIKGLIKTFKFKDAVTAKGAKARIHVGVYAQEVQAAFAANGLDANNYAMFCSDTWYVVDGQTHDADGNIYTSASTNAVAVTQLGVRYEELLAFVIAAI
jgi:hypothetical protein